MPRIFDNIELALLPSLEQTLNLSERSDFCVGYFNLRGWKALGSFIEAWPGGSGHQCRLLVGMQRLPQEELRDFLSLVKQDSNLDNQTAIRLKKRLAEEFRVQLAFGIPTNEDEAGLRRLASQLREKKVVVKLFLRHPLHAKLYLCFRPDPINPIVGYVGSSNLTLSGLSLQGELNVDVMDHDAGHKLATWFEERWKDKWCVDISTELIQILEQSWARETLIPPYHIYLKIAYHLSQEARAGLSEFRIPPEFGHRLFDYQVAAVKISAHHLNKRNGVLIGDVVGLGKTLMATAVAKIFQDDHFTETLIICPKNLVKMWEEYVSEYRLLAKVLSITRVIRELPELRRYRVVLIDESHNMRNRGGRRYRAIQEYILENESRCIMLSATPYNKTYLDLSSQLRLFIPEDKDLGVRPERLLKDLGETEFTRRHQCPLRSLAAFEKSEYADDWRELMRLFMVRRTRSFIQDNYAQTDPTNGRRFLTFEDGTRSYFPVRVPKTVKFRINERDPNDQYAKLYAPGVVAAINALNLPRYGLANYVAASPHKPPATGEANQLQDLSRAGKRLMGFCRTNLFKRLESSGDAFQQSIQHHILRNYIYLHAIENGLLLPIGTQDSGLLDTGNYDEDVDAENASAELFDDDEENAGSKPVKLDLKTLADFKTRAASIYGQYATQFKNRFKWLRSDLFVKSLGHDLESDAASLFQVLKTAGDWDPTKDAKLDALCDLLTKKHPAEKVIVFSQFADTVRYLESQLQQRGIKMLSGVTGQDEDPTGYAWRFSPESNQKRQTISPENELRVLLATDVLSEGQNLQDSAVVVNFDLPWAIIRLIQRAGRVDRIGQKSETILCYSFLPADGVENLIRLRSRVRQRLRENAEVVGTDEAFFEDEHEKKKLLDLYHEKAGILDGDDESEVDLASLAYQIWKNATDRDPALQQIIPELPAVVFSTKSVADVPSASPSKKADETSATPLFVFKPFAWESDLTKTHRRLPHWHQQGATYFITWRLADSVSQEQIKEWRQEEQTWRSIHPEPWSTDVQEEFFRRFREDREQFFDAGYGECLLRQPELSEIVERSLRYFDGERYDLGDFVVMPNHIHVLVAPRENHLLSAIVQAWKGFTAKEINKALNRSGMVWWDESFDHIVRSFEQFLRLQTYVRENPVAANCAQSSFKLGRGQKNWVTQSVADVPSASPLKKADGTSATHCIPGVLVYLRTAEGNDSLAWVDKDGNNVTQSQFDILKAAECLPHTPALPRLANHHALVKKGVEYVVAEEKSVGGQLGRPSGARFRTYERLKRYADLVKGTLFETPQLAKTIEEIYRYPLRQSAVDTLNRQLRAGISDEKLAELAMALRDDDRFCIIHEEEQSQEPQIICSMGLAGESQDEAGKRPKEGVR